MRAPAGSQTLGHGDLVAAHSSCRSAISGWWIRDPVRRNGKYSARNMDCGRNQLHRAM